jgi:hypothetical protein
MKPHAEGRTEKQQPKHYVHVLSQTPKQIQQPVKDIILGIRFHDF